MKISINTILKNKAIMQSALLLVASVFVMFSTLGINFYLTRILDKQTFGDYSFVINFFTFSQIVFNFGLFYAISRLIAINNDEVTIKRFYGVGIIIVFSLSLLMALCLYSYLKLLGNYSLDANVIEAIVLCLPFCWVFLFTNFNELLLQSSNKIELLSLSRALPKILFFFCLGLVYYFFKNDTSFYKILFLFFGCSILPYLFVVYRLKPKFSDLTRPFAKVKIATKQFGFNIYMGSILAVGASTLTGVLIGYFGDNNSEVGVYSIALQFSAPLSLIPNVLATVFFKKFANSNTIDKKLIYLLYLISFISVIGIFIISKPLILLIYGIKYIDSVQLLRLLTVSSVLYGISDFYTKFLLSKGKGKEIRNASIVVGCTLLLSNFILIKYYGAYGAACSTIISGTMYVLVIVYYMKKVVV